MERWLSGPILKRQEWAGRKGDPGNHEAQVFDRGYAEKYGEMAEWLKAAVY